MNFVEIDDEDIKYVTDVTYAVRGLDVRVPFVEDRTGRIYARVPRKGKKSAELEEVSPYLYVELLSTHHVPDPNRPDGPGINVRPISLRYKFLRSKYNREMNDVDVLFAWSPDKAVARGHYEPVPNDEAEAILVKKLATEKARAEEFMAPVRAMAKAVKEQQVKAALETKG